MTLHYRGAGRFLPGVPARDLTAEDLGRLPDRIRQRLVKSGLYVPAGEPKQRKEARPNV